MSLQLKQWQQTEEYRKHEKEAGIVKRVLTSVRSFSYEKLDANWEELVKYAEEGGLEGKRHSIHHSLLAEAEWTGLRGEKMLELILATPSVLGKRRDRETLTSQLKSIRAKNAERMKPRLWNQDDYYIAEDLPVFDFQDAKLDELTECIKRSIKLGQSVNTLVHASHGSGKTTVLIPWAKALLEETLGRPVRCLYISTTIANIQSQYKKLGWHLYITEDGKVIGKATSDYDELMCCVMSLQHLMDGKPYDLVVLDESEQIGYWSAWNNTNYNHLVDLVAQSKLALFLDADIGDLSYAMARIINEWRESGKSNSRNSIYVRNSENYIQRQTLKVLSKEDQAIEMLIRSAEEGVLTHVHLDCADNYNSLYISRLVGTLNSYSRSLGNGDIAIGFHRDMKDKSAKYELTFNQNKYIDTLVDSGIKIIVLSPIIMNGWRYNGKHKFARSIGIYRNNLHTYLDIHQKMQRFVGINEHFLYVRPKTSYSTLEQEQAIYDMEYVAKPKDSEIVRLVSTERVKADLSTLAASIKKVLLTNVLVDVYSYWMEKGGKFELIDKEAMDFQHQDLIDVFKGEKGAMLNEIYEQLGKDKWRLKNLLTHFVRIDEANNPQELEVEDYLLPDKDEIEIKAAPLYEEFEELEKLINKYKRGWLKSYPLSEEETERMKELRTKLDELWKPYNTRYKAIERMLSRVSRFGESAQEAFISEEVKGTYKNYKTVLNKNELKLEDVRRFHQLFCGNEEEWARLDGSIPSYLANEFDKEIVDRYQDEELSQSNKRFNSLLGKTLSTLREEFKAYAGWDLVEWVLSYKTQKRAAIALFTEDFKSPKFYQYINNYASLLEVALPEFDKKAKPATILARIARNYFDLEPKYTHRGVAKPVRAAKERIREEYVLKGLVPKSSKPASQWRTIQKMMLEKISRGEVLSEDEEFYIKELNQYVVLEKPEEIHKDLYFSLSEYYRRENALIAAVKQSDG